MINVLFGGNYKVYDGLLLALLSMKRHTNEALNVFVLTADVTELNPEYRPITQQNIELLNRILKEKNANSSVKLITLGKEFNDWVNSSQNKLNAYTPFAFLRLFADKLPELPEKIIYLDTDIMINGDIKELFDVDMTDLEMGIVKDRYGHIFINKNYFNSGMLLLNLKKIRETDLFTKVKEMCVNKKMAFPDQTALNKLCKYKIYLPRRFNEQGDLRKDTVVQHFSKRFTIFPYFHTINIKPWNIDKVHKVRKNFAYDDVYAEFNKIKQSLSEQEKQKEK